MDIVRLKLRDTAINYYIVGGQRHQGSVFWYGKHAPCPTKVPFIKWYMTLKGEY